VAIDGVSQCCGERDGELPALAARDEWCENLAIVATRWSSDPTLGKAPRVSICRCSLAQLL